MSKETLATEIIRDMKKSMTEASEKAMEACIILGRAAPDEVTTCEQNETIDVNRCIKDEIINRVNQVDPFWILDVINNFVKNMTEGE